MKSSLLGVVLFTVCAAHAQSLKVVPVQLVADRQFPSALQFFCTQDYGSHECEADTGTLRSYLAKYPVALLGSWTFVLATREQCVALEHRPNGSPETPALTFLSHRTTIFERDLFRANAERTAQLLAQFGMAGPPLLTWAVSHELGHATCGEPDEARADAHGRELREGKILSCSQSPGRQSNP